MKAVVFAYSDVGDRCLRVLRARGVDVPLVVTHADDPKERIWFHRVADTAADLGLEVAVCDDPADPALQRRVAAATPDFIFAFYYRRLLPDALLRLAAKGAFNMHGSLLPKYRGRAPTNWAVLMGESETGATLHEMVTRADAGAIVDQSAVPILPDDTAVEVFAKVTMAAEQVLWRSLPGLIDGTASRRPNDMAAGSYFGARRPEDGRIDWSRPARQVYDLVRAVAPPYPGAFVDIGRHRLVVAEARRLSGASRVAATHTRPGLAVVDGRILGVCGDGGCIDVRRLMEDGAIVDPARLARLLDPQPVGRDA
jgi:methionyl-tRNA formyltransferase